MNNLLSIPVMTQENLFLLENSDMRRQGGFEYLLLALPSFYLDSKSAIKYSFLRKLPTIRVK